MAQGTVPSVLPALTGVELLSWDTVIVLVLACHADGGTLEMASGGVAGERTVLRGGTLRE